MASMMQVRFAVYVDCIQSHDCLQRYEPPSPQQQLKKRLSFTLSFVVVPAPSKRAGDVPFKEITTVLFVLSA